MPATFTLVAEGGLVKEMSASSKHINLPKAFSEGEPTQWFQKYEICCDANNWDGVAIQESYA